MRTKFNIQPSKVLDIARFSKFLRATTGEPVRLRKLVSEVWDLEMPIYHSSVRIFFFFLSLIFYFFSKLMPEQLYTFISSLKMI